MVSAVEGMAMVGYIRVSQVGGRAGERFISPVVQREAIERWAAAHRAHVLEIFTEFDESGARPDRPQLAAALQLIEAGAAQGMVVWKVSRFSRSLLDGLSTIQRVRSLGGEFVSVYEGFDTTTESGRLMLRFMLAMAETDLEHMRQGYATAQIKMVERGGYSGAYAPVGYRRSRAGRLRPDPGTGPLMTEVFRLRAEGWSRLKLCRWLEERGVPTAKGNAGWADSTLANVLRNRVYLGEVAWSGHVREGAHAPLTDPVTWDAAQRPRQRTAEWSRRPALLAGLVRCASCSMIMSAAARRDACTDRVRRYGCRGHSAAGRCPGPASISNDYLEPYVELAALELLRRRRRLPVAALRAVEVALDTAERDLAAYRDSPRLLRVLGETDFAAGLESRSLRAREARARVAYERGRHALHALPPTAVLEASWPTLGIDDKRRTIEAVVDCVFVSPGRLDVEPRITVCPRGSAPARLPRAGDKGGQARAFKPTRRTPRPTHVALSLPVVADARRARVARRRPRPQHLADPSGVPRGRRLQIASEHRARRR